MTKPGHIGESVRRAGRRVLLAGLLLGPGVAEAESSLRVAVPEAVEVVDVATYDEEARTRVGGGEAGWEALGEGRFRFRAVSGIEGGERTEATALFERAGGAVLRPLRQESRSFDASGEQVGHLRIDHEARRGACDRRDESPVAIELPEEDRIANVVIGAAVTGLLQSGDERSSLQLFVCRFGGRVLDAKARIVGTESWPGGELIEVRLGPDLGRVLRSLIGPFLPEIPMWFDRASSEWLGHRLPLYPEAPTVTVLRADVAAGLARHIAR